MRAPRSFYRSINIVPAAKRSFWHFNKIEKIVIVSVITAILLVSFLGFSMTADPTQPIDNTSVTNPTTTPSPALQSNSSSNPTSTTQPQITTTPDRVPFVPVVQGPQTDPVPGLIESNPTMDNTTWYTIARNAWSFFQPGRGIDSTTGLPAGSIGWNYFTDWDLGVYIQAIIDAQKIGLIGADGAWGSHDRLEKVVSWLETRELINGTTPYQFYKSDGTPDPESAKSGIDIMDTGTLLAALGNVKDFDSSFSNRINNIVYNGLQNNRTNYAALVSGLKNYVSSSNIYDYYMLSGFAKFWHDQLGTIPDKILDNIRNAPTITAYNVTLTKGAIACEPLLYSVFNSNNGANTNLTWLMNLTYSAHEAMYNATGQYIAFSEGISSIGFIWEWVVSPYGDAWKITTSDGSYSTINPVIYNKVAISFLALYNTTFAYNMAVYLEKLSPDPSTGYCAGADYNKDINLANVYPSVDSNTNGLILSAARCALHD